MRKFVSCLSLFVVVSILQIPVSSQVSITTLGAPGAYSQNFDFLTSLDFPLIDNNPVTNPGIYAFRATVAPPGPNNFDAEAGTDNAGEFNNYGAVGNGERAMGSLTSAGAPNLQYGIRFVNNTGSAIASVQVVYTGEQWRVANTNPQTLGFGYRQAATVTDLTTGTYTGVAALNFVSPTLSGTASALNGNDPLNRVTFSASFAVAIPVGEEIMIRWIDTDDGGSDHGLSIDDLTVTFRAQSTAGEVSIAGRVTTATGRGIGKTRVILVGGDLTEPLVALTNPFGYYSFNGLDAGQTYVVSVQSKRHSFGQSSMTVTPGDDAAGVDFTAEP